MNRDTEKMHRLWRIVKADKEYSAMNRELLSMEERFSLIISRLSEEEQDAVWAYVCLSGAMDWRIMEIVCEKMRFSSEIPVDFVRN